MYEVRLSEDAEKVFVKCDKALTKKLARCFRNLENNPRSHHIDLEFHCRAIAYKDCQKS